MYLNLKSTLQLIRTSDSWFDTLSKDPAIFTCKLLGCNVSLHCLPATIMRLCHLEASTKLGPWDISWVRVLWPETIQRTRNRRANRRGFLTSGRLPWGLGATFSCIFSTRWNLPLASFSWTPSITGSPVINELRYLFSTPSPSLSSQGGTLSPANNLCLKSLQNGRACEQSLSRAPCICWDRFRLSTLYLLLGCETQIWRCLFHSPAVESLLNNLALRPLRTGHLVPVGCCLRQKMMWDGF